MKNELAREVCDRIYVPMHGHVLVRNADAYVEIGEHGGGGSPAEDDGEHNDDRRRRHDHVPRERMN